MICLVSFQICLKVVDQLICPYYSVFIPFGSLKGVKVQGINYLLMDSSDILNIFVQLAGKSRSVNINQVLLCFFPCIGFLNFRLALFDLGSFEIDDIRVICIKKVLNGLSDSFSISLSS